jgi:hypothetical protein
VRVEISGEALPPAVREDLLPPTRYSLSNICLLIPALTTRPPLCIPLGCSWLCAGGDQRRGLAAGGERELTPTPPVFSKEDIPCNPTSYPPPFPLPVFSIGCPRLCQGGDQRRGLAAAVEEGPQPFFGILSIIDLTVAPHPPSVFCQAAPGCVRVEISGEALPPAVGK